MNRNELLNKKEEKLEEIEELKAEIKEIEEEIEKLGSKYESIIILNTNISTEVFAEIKAMINKITNYYNAEDIGIRKLPYEVRGQKEGYYFKIEFEGNKDIVAELERYYRIKDEIIKFLTVRVEEF